MTAASHPENSGTVFTLFRKEALLLIIKVKRSCAWGKFILLTHGMLWKKKPFYASLPFACLL